MARGTHYATLQQKLEWLRKNRDLWAVKWKGKIELVSTHNTFAMMRDAGLYSKLTVPVDAISGVKKLMKSVLSGKPVDPSGFRSR